MPQPEMLALARSGSASRPQLWPLPALAAWALAWGAWPLLGGWPAALLPALLAALWPGLSRGRRCWMALGFPAAVLALGLAGGWPAWVWLLPLALLLVAYPLRAWRDAPLFPTPPAALRGLGQLAPLPEGAAVLDAGCGLGQGLKALRAEYPQARLTGTEWSPLLAWAVRRRCRDARVRRGDLWADDWGQQQLVYLFQRPESMPRAWAKACAEMAPGSWLVSLDFAVPGLAPSQRLQAPGGQPVWLYRVPDAVSGAAHAAQPPAAEPGTQPDGAPADKNRRRRGSHVARAARR